jgi:hypothetical protein
LYNLAAEGKTNHTIKVYSGIYAEESKKLLDEFFTKVRKQQDNGKNGKD